MICDSFSLKQCKHNSRIGPYFVDPCLPTLNGYIRLRLPNGFAHWTHNHKIMGSSPVTIKKHPAWAMGDDNGASVHSAVTEYLAMDRDGNCT